MQIKKVELMLQVEIGNVKKQLKEIELKISKLRASLVSMDVCLLGWPDYSDSKSF